MRMDGTSAAEKDDAQRHGACNDVVIARRMYGGGRMLSSQASCQIPAERMATNMFLTYSISNIFGFFGLPMPKVFFLAASGRSPLRPWHILC
jgi:hypothetical protein